MDLRTGRTYATREEARAAGVPEADIAELVRTAGGDIEPRFAPETVRGVGPFKGRVYGRDVRTGNLVRVK